MGLRILAAHWRKLLEIACPATPKRVGHSLRRAKAKSASLAEEVGQLEHHRPEPGNAWTEQRAVANFAK